LSLSFEELDYKTTPLGELILRRRHSVQIPDLDIYEVQLGDAFLMSSLFHESEDQLASLGLGMVTGDEIDVLVGGLGLGYTAVKALKDKRVRSLHVVEYMDAVIDWHRTGLVPLGKTLAEDPRCTMLQGDFFARCRDTDSGFDPDTPGRKYDAILLDIDHTPTRVLNQTNTHFYTRKGLEEVTAHLNPGGVFALWSDSEPEAEFTKHLRKVFPKAQAHMIRFDNPYTGKSCGNTVYLAQTA